MKNFNQSIFSRVYLLLCNNGYPGRIARTIAWRFQEHATESLDIDSIGLNGCEITCNLFTCIITGIITEENIYRSHQRILTKFKLITNN